MTVDQVLTNALAALIVSCLLSEIGALKRTFSERGFPATINRLCWSLSFLVALLLLMSDFLGWPKGIRPVLTLLYVALSTTRFCLQGGSPSRIEIAVDLVIPLATLMLSTTDISLAISFKK